MCSSGGALVGAVGSRVGIRVGGAGGLGLVGWWVVGGCCEVGMGWCVAGLGRVVAGGQLGVGQGSLL